MTASPSDITGATDNTAVPRIINEDNHPLRPEMLDKDAVFVMKKLNKAGFASYLVGGGVRDLYLGKSPKDFDVSTEARPGQIRQLFPNSAIIGKRFRLVQVFFKAGKIIEVSTLRSLDECDIDGPEAVLAPNNTYGTLPDDAQRRDLSINSLFYELEHHTIIDYVGGVADLDASIVRITGEPAKRINADPVRMMRAIRHSSRTGFSIEEKTWKAICDNKEKIRLCPSSRIRDEILKDLYGGCAEEWFKRATACGLFCSIFPFYTNILHKAPQAQPTCIQQLGLALRILDGIAQHLEEGQRFPLPKFFIFALLLLPWAEMHFNLSTLSLKGPDHFHLTKAVRRDIDAMIGTQLNLRRVVRQEMVTLICSIPQFVRFAQDGTAPKWLRRKSYFANCRLFNAFRQAILSEDIARFFATAQSFSVPTLKEHSSEQATSSSRKIKPAFSSKNKGSIFGLHKRKK